MARTKGESVMISLLLLFACAGNKGDTANCAVSADIDGIGSDTGNLPDLFGNYTTTFGTRSFYDECNVEDISRLELDWINGGAMNIGGRLDDVDVSLASAPDADLTAIMSEHGSVAISGRFVYRGQELHIALGGLLFENTQLDRIEIEGHGFLGMDTNDDGSINCGILGDFNAKRSL
jgi:hypothetical protein